MIVAASFALGNSRLPINAAIRARTGLSRWGGGNADRKNSSKISLTSFPRPEPWKPVISLRVRSEDQNRSALSGRASHQPADQTSAPNQQE